MKKKKKKKKQNHKTFLATASPHITKELSPEITLHLYRNKEEKDAFENWGD
jgi:hypothetical protein